MRSKSADLPSSMQSLKNERQVNRTDECRYFLWSEELRVLGQLEGMMRRADKTMCSLLEEH